MTGRWPKWISNFLKCILTKEQPVWLIEISGLYGPYLKVSVRRIFPDWLFSCPIVLVIRSKTNSSLEIKNLYIRRRSEISLLYSLRRSRELILFVGPGTSSRRHISCCRPSVIPGKKGGNFQMNVQIENTNTGVLCVHLLMESFCWSPKMLSHRQTEWYPILILLYPRFHATFNLNCKISFIGLATLLLSQRQRWCLVSSIILKCGEFREYFPT